MTQVWVAQHDWDGDAFKAWLRQNGAEVIAPTNEYEAVRYRWQGKTSIAYFRPSKRRVTLTGYCGEHYLKLFRAGLPFPTAELPAETPPAAGELILYTDASNYHQTRAGAWAAILVLPGGVEVEASGELRGDVTSSSAAEAMAVANALHRFIAQGHIARGSTVRVICDNAAVVRYVGIGKVKKSKSEGVKDAITYVGKLRDRYGLVMRSEWVRGHQRQDSVDPRAAYNWRCDKLCGAQPPS